MAEAEHHARRGEIVVDEQAVQQLGNNVSVVEWRTDEKTRQRFAVITGLAHQTQFTPEASFPLPSLSEDQVRAWLLPPVYKRLTSGQGRFLTELIPSVAVFLKFGEIDYDADEAAGDKLDAFVRWVQKTLLQYEGYLVNLTSGDKGSYLHAVFGAPLAHDDDPARATAAALELRGLPPELHFVTSVQIGINRGLAWAGAYGGSTRCAYDILGDGVNVAARLMQRAESGQILISQPVADAAMEQYEFESAGLIAVKGRAASLHVYAVIGRRSTPVLRRSIGRLVGRTHELAELERLLDVAAVGRGQIVSLSGPAGIGKSRLIEEWAERAHDLGWRVLFGTCYSTAHGIAYYPWRQIFREWLDLRDSMHGDVEFAPIIRRVEEITGDINSSWQMRLPLLRDLLELPIPDNPTTAAYDPPTRQAALFALVVELIQAAASRQPLLFVIDNAHWLDEASLQLMLNLGRNIEQLPIGLAAAHRADKPILGDLSPSTDYHALDLGTLPSAAIAELVRLRLGEALSPLALDVILARAGGNPWFAGQLVDDLKERQQLVRGETGRWTLAEVMVNALYRTNCLKRREGDEWQLAENAPLSAAELELPGDVQRLIQARVDRLPEAHRLTLKVASVIGARFDLNLLVHSHPNRLDPSAVYDQIDMMRAHGLVEWISGESSTSGTFKDNITHDAIYEALPEDQRRELHGAVGAALESRWRNEVEQLAYHYSRSARRDKQMVYLDKAARKAQRESLNETALNYYRQALALKTRWKWLKGQAEILHIFGRRDDEQRVLKELEEIPETPPAVVTLLWSRFFEARGEYPQAQERIERALRIAGDRADRLGEIRCLNQLGAIAARQGDFSQAKERYDAVVTLLRDQASLVDEEAHTLIQALNGLGTVLGQQGDFDEADASLAKALDLSHKRGYRLDEAQVFNNRGWLAFYQGNFASAVNHQERAIKIRREIGDRVGEGASLYNWGIALLAAGNYSQAKTYLLQAEPIHRMTGNRWYEVKVRNALGIYCLMIGDWAQARAYLQYSRELANEIGDKAGEADALCNLGLLHTGLFAPQAQDLAEAKRMLMDSMAISLNLRERYLMSMCHSYLGLVSLQASQLSEAEEHASQALTMRQEIGLQQLTTIDYTTLAQSSLSAGDLDAAVKYIGEAFKILDKCRGEGPEFPQRDYFICYQVWLTAGQQALAWGALKAAYDLVIAKANKISDPAVQKSFREKVSFNREIIEAYESMGRTVG
jgi:class 3 adenylate cyclase/tetratricopeptide (TPR) repeat protein